jgi:hypothetical protein
MAAFRGVVSHGIESTESKFWILEKKASDLLRAVKPSITGSNAFFWECVEIRMGEPGYQ